MPGDLVLGSLLFQRRPMSEVASPVAVGEQVQSDGYSEADVIWRKSSWSGVNGNCVEVAALRGGLVAVRDTKDAGCGPILTFGSRDWDAFVDALKNGDLPE